MSKSCNIANKACQLLLILHALLGKKCPILIVRVMCYLATPTATSTGPARRLQYDTDE